MWAYARLHPCLFGGAYALPQAIRCGMPCDALLLVLWWWLLCSGMGQNSGHEQGIGTTIGKGVQGDMILVCVRSVHKNNGGSSRHMAHFFNTEPPFSTTVNKADPHHSFRAWSTHCIATTHWQQTVLPERRICRESRWNKRFKGVVLVDPSGHQFGHPAVGTLILTLPKHALTCRPAHSTIE